MGARGSFDCRRCGAFFTPADDQWIFHFLCDACFLEYERVKCACMPLKPPPSVDEWIEATKA